jgi:hypothetical protein
MEAAMKTTALKLLVLALVLTGMTWAAEDDEPGRGVARISLMNGDVSVRRGDSGDWVAAAVNAPLSVEDTVVTGANSRAEVQLDWANLIRLSANAEVRLAELEDQRYMVQVARGLVTFRVLRESDANVEISTPNVSVRPAGMGTYRIEVQENGDSEITVRSGNADIFTPRGSQQLQAGRTMLARGTASDPEFKIIGAIGRDEWDRWNENRDSYFTQSASYQYVDSSIDGAEDLDAYGSWSYAAPYGYVWSPRVAAGWAPYSYGQWSWMDYYGWSWVSYDPWGWAPFHYGRWFYNGPRGWCWYPGAMHTRQYWRPGLVAFFGYGGRGGLGVGFGFGNVGWVPLAPYETYRPWYGRGMYGGYRNTTIGDNSVRIVNNTNMVNAYRNARIPNAVSGVDASQFGRRNANLIRVSDGQMRSADLVQGRMPVAPNRDSLRVSNRDVNPGSTPRTTANERFVSRRQPDKVDRVPFDQQQRAMEQVARRTFNQPSAVTRTEGAAAPAAANTPRSGQGTAPRSFAPADNGSSGTRPRTAPQDRVTTDGWRRFGGTTTSPADSGGGPARTNEQPRTSPNAAPGNQANSWRRFEGTNGDPASQPSRVESPRYQAPPADRNSGGGQIRISQPIIRQREAAPPPPSPRASEQHYSAPARQAPSSPRYSAPARQAPSSGGGGSRTSAAPSRSRNR